MNKPMNIKKTISQDQAERLICGVISAVNSAASVDEHVLPVHLTFDQVTEIASKHLPHTQFHAVLTEILGEN